MKDKKTIGNSQHALEIMPSQSDICNTELTNLLGEGKAADDVYLNFSTADPSESTEQPQKQAYIITQQERLNQSPARGWWCNPKVDTWANTD